MKNIFLWVTAFILSLTSCQQSEVVDNINAGNNQLNFGVYQGKATRAGELTNSDLNKDNVSFPLYAYRGKQDAVKTSYFIETLTYDEANAEWKTSIPRFLPEGETEFLQFYAFYAPSANNPQGGIRGVTYNEELDANKYPTLDYTIQDTQVDLVAASVNDNTGKSIVIPFKHILSQINFAVKGYYGAKIYIRNININKVFDKGTFNFNPAPDDWGWTGHLSPKDYEYKFAGGATAAASTFNTPGQAAGSTLAEHEKETEYFYILGDGGKWGPGSGSGKESIWYVIGANNSTIQASTITEATPQLSNSLILMPQELAEGTTAAWVTFEYKISDLGTPAAWVVGGAGNASGTDWIVGKFDLHLGTSTTNPVYEDEWKPNLRYIYTIDFTGFLDGQKLTFDVDVDANPWENYNDPDGDGIVLLSSLDGAVFNKVIKTLKSTDQAKEILEGHLFSNIIWDWSPYAMDNTFAAGGTFKVKFTNVKFNGNTLTIKPPFGFDVSSDATNYVTTIDVTTPGTELTFKATAAYYGNVVDLNAVITANTNYVFNVSNSILLSSVRTSTLTTVSNTITLNFASAYGKPVPKNWKLTNSGKTATYTVPAPVVP